MISKNEEYIVDIIDNGIEGEGIAKIDNFTIFIQGAIKGEKVKIVILKVLKSYAYGKIIDIIEKSESRIESDCDTYKRCGGCNLRHIDYKETLNIKRNIVQNLIDKNLKTKIIVNDTIGMEKPYFYRNKAQHPVGISKDGSNVIGVFANRSHEIIPFKKCYIQNEETEEIAKYVFDLWNKYNLSIYNETTQKGLLRHIVTKIGIKTNEIMIVLVINGDKFQNENELVDEIISRYPHVKTIVKNINKKNTNIILGEKNIALHGDGFIKDILGDFYFKISPLSFYQVNPIQAERLYNIAVEAAQISKEDVAFDLYCGIGTISLFMSKYAKKVYGIEIIEEAVKMANENAKINNINNTEFIAGDMEYALDDLINKKGISADVVLVDPPRKGLDNKSIENILKIKPNRFVYISCNPATLVRDLASFEEEYDILKVQPVDMFPWTSHIETIAVMKYKHAKD